LEVESVGRKSRNAVVLEERGNTCVSEDAVAYRSRHIVADGSRCIESKGEVGSRAAGSSRSRAPRNL